MISMRKFAAFVIAILLELIALAIISSAAPVMVDFEDQSTTGPGEGGQVTASHQYESKGITFNEPVILDYSRGVDPSKYQGFAHSGTKAIEQCYGKEFCTTPIQMKFKAPQKYVRVWVGYSGSLSAQNTVIMRAFDLAGAQVKETTTVFQPSTTPIPIQIPMEVISDSANIYSVTMNLASDANSPIITNHLAVDDVEFDTFGPLLICNIKKLPSKFDWRNYQGYNWMTPVEDQGNCGGCWAYAAVGGVEAKYKIMNFIFHPDIDLSEHYLIDQNKGGNCGGGNELNALKEIQTGGIVRVECFPNMIPNCKDRIFLKDIHQINPTTDDIKRAILCFGPLVVGSNTWVHSFIIVGWDDDMVLPDWPVPPHVKGRWIEKNSWGIGYGDKGYGTLPYDHPFTDFINEAY
jgi:hypothetical protein